MTRMPPFNGRRDNLSGVAATLASGWTGSVTCSRDRRTVTIDLNPLRTSWAAGQQVCTLPEDMRPTVARYMPAFSLATGGVVLLLLYTTGVVQAVFGSTSTGGGGIVGAVTYVR